MKKEDFDCRIIDVDITDNEVIARFMDALKKYDERGGMPCVLLSGGGVPVPGWYFNDKEILYSTSYDWLMPVWHKFKQLKFESIDHAASHHEMCEREIGFAILNYGCAGACKILAEGIRWYNSTQNKEKS